MRINKKQVGGVLGAAVIAVTGLLVTLEGNPGKPYLDVAGVLTDCYGNTKDVSWDFVRSQEECVALLNGEAERIGTFIYKDLPNLNVNELTALISWTYNVGDGAYRSSTLRKKFKAGDHLGGCMEMYRWRYITVRGKKVPSKGLDNRRDREVQICTGSK